MTDVIARLDPNLPVENLKTLDQQARENVFLDRMISTLPAAFALLATLLAAINLYGVLAYTVAQRTREIGVRMALGAGSSDVMRLVLGEGVAMAAAGVALGLAGAAALTRLMAGLLFGVTARDPATFAAGAALLMGVAVLASYIPARRALRVQPTSALRAE